MAETVRRIEAAGPLDDAEVLRGLASDPAAQHDREAWLLARAARLGTRLGLDGLLQRWRGVSGLALLALVAVVLLASLATAGAVVHSGRTLNAVAGFMSLLGLHILTLALWLMGLVAPWPASGGALGRLWLEAVSRLGRLGRGGDSNTTSLLAASLALLRRERLLPWLFGGISHTVWALSFGVMLAVLGFAFAFQSYRLTWETTILGPEFFVRFVQATGWLPGRLGFPVPDTATLLAPGAASADQRAWAWWLIGCVLVYGLLPRVVLALVCVARWRQRLSRLRLDTADPYYRALLARRDALQPAAVVDAEAHWQAPRHDAASFGVPGTGAALVGFELAPEIAWPPPVVPADVAVQRIAGSSAERAAVLQVLAQARPARLLIACQASSSPDRGTARFLREAASHAAACRLWLLAANPVDTADLARWSAWLQADPVSPTGTVPVIAMSDAGAAMAWLTEKEAPDG